MIVRCKTWDYRSIRGTVFVLALLYCGCASTQPQITLPGTPPLPQEYRIHCPDQVEIRCSTRPEIAGTYQVDPEGRIALTYLGNPRIEGETLESARSRIAALAQVPVETAQCWVSEYRSRMVYVFGPVRGPARAIPFQGSESVVAFLQRSGGLTHGAALRHVHVVRANVAIGSPPQVFEVDLRAILANNDWQTDVLVQPFDEIYVGETRRSILAKLAPDWLKPVQKRMSRWMPGS